MSRIWVSKLQSKFQVSEEDIEEMFSFADQDRDGKIRDDDQDKNLQTGLSMSELFKLIFCPPWQPK